MDIWQSSCMILQSFQPRMKFFLSIKSHRTMKSLHEETEGKAGQSILRPLYLISFGSSFHGLQKYWLFIVCAAGWTVYAGMVFSSDRCQYSESHATFYACLTTSLGVMLPIAAHYVDMSSSETLCCAAVSLRFIDQYWSSELTQWKAMFINNKLGTISPHFAF